MIVKFTKNNHFIEYYFKDFHDPGKKYQTIELTKFEGNKMFSAKYLLKRVIKTGKITSCSCPGYVRTRGNCKHIDMVLEWIKNGKPSPFDPGKEGI
jgi:hypothetical protein